MVYCESLSVWPVRMSTTRSSRVILPRATSFLRPARVTAEAGSQPTPSAPISALASAISCSETCSHQPPSSSITAAAFQVGLELDGERTVVHRLRELAPGNLALRNENDAAKTGAGSISSHCRRSIACRGACDPLEAALGGDGEGGRHAGVFEGAGGV